ncbi:hypothetical protein FQN52_007807 [Onygenales sp. PD_12]|nr:hypothetical protein FQN52_007807 [Onygenales sp. PD_12]
MESSPLTLAHSHARNALFETRKANPVAASEEHDLAAGEFATAAQGSADPDALRTLQLLEKHHKRLAELLRFQHEHPPVLSPESTNVTSFPTTAPPTKLDALDTKPSSAAAFPPLEAANHPPRLPAKNRTTPREITSIASNLASARGIPSHPRGSPVSPTISTQNAGAKMVSSPSRPMHDDPTNTNGLNTESKTYPSLASRSKPSWTPTAISPTDITSQETVPSEAYQSNKLGFGFPTDEGFQKFYSTFGDIISKISGPLAFTSLPLGHDQPSQKPAADISIQSMNKPDVSKLVSGAALRAIRDRDSSNGPPGHINPAESFYVVPTAGGTISYAGILSRAEKEARRNSLEDSHHDDFVDARESPPSPESSHALMSDKARKRTGRSRAEATTQGPARAGTKTREELEMENQALKHLSDTLSKRLHMWEVNAQSSSLALQQSLKAMHHQSTATPTRQLSPVSFAHPPPHPVLASTPTGPTQATPSPPPPATGQEGAAAVDQPPHNINSYNEEEIQEILERLMRREKELQRVGRENEKLRDVVGRYRDRWEKLKEGARVRRGTNGDGEGNGNRNGEENGKGAAKGSSRGEGAAVAGAGTGDGGKATVQPLGEGDGNNGDGEDGKGLLDD